MDLRKDIETECTSTTLVLETRQFSRDAALRASYWFSNELYVEFPPTESQSEYSVVLRRKLTVPTLENPSPKSLAQLASDFQNALVDSELRVRVQDETMAIRELIFAKAFAEAGVLEDGPPGTYDDPVRAAENSANPTLVTIESKE